MLILETLNNIRELRIPAGSAQVVETVSMLITRRIHSVKIKRIEEKPITSEPSIFNIAIIPPVDLRQLDVVNAKRIPDKNIYLKIDETGSGYLITSHAYYLFSFVNYLLDYLINQEIRPFLKGKIFSPAFAWQRISYDYFLTQEGRIQRNLKRDTYVEELARLGFTHVEVNGLASPMGMETGPKGETYPMFYTYCPALDQFVSSKLNQGLYSDDWLSANLEFLKENARLAVKYGITPGLLCFEPRSVPERFFDRYPMLRGARVDHPFRSFKPRYNMTITHPLVRDHYAEMLQKLMKEVPELGYITIWTNDSGAGFEHTKSLYVGRNGGAYMIREWKDDAEIARLAGENALRFFRVLRDAGREINPGFRVITRMESFYGEHDTIWRGLGDSVEIETASLIAKGWDMPYTHPRYPDSKSINAGTVYQQQFYDQEKPLMDELHRRNAEAHFYFAAGANSMFAPLLGIPYPRLTYQRLKRMNEGGVTHLAHTGGTLPPEIAPYNVNHEIVRQFQFDPEMDIKKSIEKLALRWAGQDHYGALIAAWKLTEEAILAFPNITPLYSTYGFAWYRLWARPLVPEIESIPQVERDYYQEFMCTTPHNPNNVDLSRDVLFQLTTPEKSRLDVERIDSSLWEPMDKAIQVLAEIEDYAINNLGNGSVIHDQLIRLRALRCWFMTQRNVAAWIASVYEYMNYAESAAREKEQNFLRDAIIMEIENSKELMKLLAMDIEFMALTDKGETPLMYGDNLKELLSKRIELMQKHIDDEPFIDHGYMEREAAGNF